MKYVIPFLAMFIICSADKGLTRTTFRNAHNIFYAEQCLVFEADEIEGQYAACEPTTECVIREGTVPPAGSDMRSEKDK